MATLDVVTVAEAKTALNISVTTWDTELQSYVTAASLLLDKECGPVVQRTVVETRDGNRSPRWTNSATGLWLYQTPIVSVTSIIEYDQTVGTTLTAEANATKTANDYSIDLTSGRLRRRRSGYPWYFPNGVANIVVTYVAGRYADTTSVDARFKQAALLILSNLWRREQGAGSSTFGAVDEPAIGATYFLPNSVRELISDDLRGPLVG